MEIIFDTYAWIEYFQGTSKGRVVEKYLEGNKVLTPAVVLLELNYKSDKEGWDFKRYFNFIKSHSKIIGMNEKFVFSFGNFYNKIRKKLRNMGITGIIILHTAVLNDAKVLTGDKHFKSFEQTIML